MLSGGILLTQSDGVLRPIAVVLGYLMDGIFVVLDKMGIPNVGLAIIIFTIIIYACLTPLTVKQQMFSKLFEYRCNKSAFCFRNEYFLF